LPSVQSGAYTLLRVNMNRLAKLLPLDKVLLGLSVTSKKRVFEQAGLIFENTNGIARSVVTDNLFARERLGSTGLGEGVAIPHGRIKGPPSCVWPSRFRSNRPTVSRSDC
jgi:PTS system nitrogen regulatory IIA component